MRACVRSEDGEWFEVGQGLPQGYVLSPLLFNVFFAAVLRIALERFSRNTDILGDLVHLDESPKGMVSETALDVGMCAVWGMLYADDGCIVSRSPRGTAKTMSVFVEVIGVCV